MAELAFTRVEPKTLRPEDELRAFLAALDGAGAVVSFVGVTRPSDRAGAAVASLRLDHYPAMTERSLEEIAARVHAKFGGVRLALVHRVGEVAAGEAIVFAAAAAAHRRAAFQAADMLMDLAKTEAMLWKREDGASGGAWIEPTKQDRADAARWE